MQNQIPNNWQELKFGQVATLHRGYDLPIEKMTKGNHPVVFSNGKIEYHNQYKIKGPGVITGRSGSLGNTFYIKDDYWPHNTTLYVSDFHKNNPKFIYYLLKTLNFSFLNAGSGVPTLNRNHVHEIPLKIPTNHETQKQISSILSAFDDKIEVNNKIAKTLEEMAQALFKEWFLKAEYPVGKLSDIAKITMGQSPSSEFYNNEGKGLPFHQGVTNFGNRFPKHEIYCTQNNRIGEKGDILFSVRAPVGRLNIADTKISLGRGVASIRHKNGDQSFLYYLLKRLFKKEDSLGGGSVFPAVTKDDMENMKIMIPEDQVVKTFEGIVKGMDKKIELTEKENLNLAALRDLLLPKLMKGEISL